MKNLKVCVFLFFGACLAALVLLVSAQAQQYKATTVYVVDWYFSPSDFPCLNETIHVTGAFEETLHVVTNAGGGYSWQLHQTQTQRLVAVGMDTGEEYVFVGPLSYEENGKGDGWVIYYPFEFTFHNINHFIGPGKLQNIYWRVSAHGTYDWETGELKVEFARDDLLCH